jgi:hypothetical protein
VHGTGPSIDKKFNVSDFKGIDVSSGFDVILIQGSSESLTLTAQENLFEYITAKVENGTLKIYTRNNLRSTQPMKARITFKEISNLKVSGGGDIDGETPLNVVALDVNISGGGDFSSAINTEELKYSISGGGDTKIDGKQKIIIAVSGEILNQGKVPVVRDGGRVKMFRLGWRTQLFQSRLLNLALILTAEVTLMQSIFK